jgi:hypothetical protein
MPNCNPKEFQTLLHRIPKNIIENVWFFPLRGNNKSPDVPTGNVIKNNLTFKLDSHAALKRFYNGLNVGVYALPGGLMFLDLGITKTFTVKSRNGGYHFYYLNDGKWKNQQIKINGQVVGELRTNWQYVVAAGSYIDPSKDNHDGNGVYRIVNNLPIEKFTPGILTGSIGESSDEIIRDVPQRFKSDKGKVDKVENLNIRLLKENKTLIMRAKNG